VICVADQILSRQICWDKFSWLFC